MLFLARACDGVTCPAATSCRCGSCSPNAIEDLDDWTGVPFAGDPCRPDADGGVVRCDGNLDCDDRVECTIDRCNDGICANMPDSDFYDVSETAALGASTAISSVLEADCLTYCDALPTVGCCYVFWGDATAACYYSLGTAITPNGSPFVGRSAGICQ